MLRECTSLISVTVREGYDNTIGNLIFFKCPSLEYCKLPEGATLIGIQVFYDCTSLKTVYLPSSLTRSVNNSLLSRQGNSANSYYIFRGCTALEDVQLGSDWNMDLDISISDNITVNSMIAMFNSLKDLTDTTAKTLTLGSTNLAKLTDKQKAIATNKNWTLA